MDDGWLDGLKIKVKLDNDKKEDLEQKGKDQDNKNLSNIKKDQSNKQDKNLQIKNAKD